MDRKKTRHNRGRKSGYGSKKKHRGAGSRGGRGRANLNKHKRSLTSRMGLSTPYDKMHMKSIQKRYEVINLTEINHLAVKDDLKEIDLEGYKVLGTGKLTKKITIKANTFSKTAMEKIAAAGAKAEPLEPLSFEETEETTEAEPEVDASSEEALDAAAETEEIKA